jgi:hypothetical protein
VNKKNSRPFFLATALKIEMCDKRKEKGRERKKAFA